MVASIILVVYKGLSELLLFNISIYIDRDITVCICKLENQCLKNSQSEVSKMRSIGIHKCHTN